MTIPVGTWHVVTNLHSSILNITSVDVQGHITGTIQVGPSETHGVSGTWDSTKKELVFTYSLSLGTGPIIPLPLTFTGYFFQGAGQGLFNQPPGPVTTSQPWNLLAVTFQSIFVFPGSHPHGWVARMA